MVSADKINILYSLFYVTRYNAGSLAHSSPSAE
jgi:hypothetical protein